MNILKHGLENEIKNKYYGLTVQETMTKCHNQKKTTILLRENIRLSENISLSQKL